MHVYFAQHCFFLSQPHMPFGIQNAAATSKKTKAPGPRFTNSGQRFTPKNGVDSYVSMLDCTLPSPYVFVGVLTQMKMSSDSTIALSTSVEKKRLHPLQDFTTWSRLGWNRYSKVKDNDARSRTLMQGQIQRSSSSLLRLIKKNMEKLGSNTGVARSRTMMQGQGQWCKVKYNDHPAVSSDW